MSDNARAEEKRAKLKQLIEKTREFIAKSNVDASNSAIVATSRRIAARLQQSKSVDAKIFKKQITV
jgi:hypothetical protein